MIAYLIHVPEATDGGEGLEVVATYEAKDDHTECDPWEMACKEEAKSMEHLVKVEQSRHRSPPVVEDCLEENDRIPTVCPSKDSARMLSYQELPTSIQL